MILAKIPTSAESNKQAIQSKAIRDEELTHS
jgi:hypothetical protein